jgi:methanogenic corrinoid protein MtbC1
MRHYTERSVPRARAAQLVRQAFTAALDSNPGIPAGDVRKALHVLHTSLDAFDAAPADRTLQRLAAVFTPAVILRDVALPYLREVGRRWECGEATVAQEHFASCFFEAWMLRVAHGSRTAASGRAVLACVPGEQHVLGLAAFAIVVRDLGWHVTFLGRDTPLGSVRFAGERVAADAVVLAAVVPQTLAAVAGEVAELGRSLPVVVGGPATSGETPAVLARRILPHDLLVAAQILAAQVDDGAAARPAAAAAS